MVPILHRLGLALASAALLTLAACSGDSASVAAGPSPTAPVASAVTLSGVVADGLIQGATACYDLNDNNVCDAGEPTSSVTNADGSYALAVPAAEAGKHAIIALIPATAIDADNPGVPVGVAFSLKAPAQTDTSKPVFVSPLTTAVVEVMAAAGTKDPAAAIEQVKQALGLSTSPLDNFVAAKTTGTADQQAEARRAAALAQVLTEVNKEVAKTANSANVSEDQKRALTSVILLNALNSVAESVASQGTSTANDLAKATLSTQGLTTATVVIQAQIATQIVAATKETTATSATPTPFVNLRDFTYTDANNWSYRLFTGNDVADADGFKYANDVRKELKAGADKPFVRDQSYFNTATSKWYECPSDGYLTIQFKDPTATTDQSSLGCRTYATTSKRTNETIAGSSIRDVVTRIRASGLPRGQGTNTYATWGPDPSLIAANLTFPAGSVLRYQLDTATATPDGHSLSSKVRVGKDPSKAFEQWPFAASLDEMIEFYPGTFNGASANGSNTDGLRDIPDGSVTDPALQKVKNYRVAYQKLTGTTGNARFYLCRRNASNGFTNCNGSNGQVLFDTTYSIETKGDARVLRFASFPADNEGYWKYRRNYVERTGAVFYGFKDTLQTTTTLRLNAPAWAALRSALSIDPHTDPAAPAALEASSTWLRDMRRGPSYATGDAFTIRWVTFNGIASGTTDEVRLRITNTAPFTTTTFARNALFWNGTTWLTSDGTDQACPSNGVVVGTWNSNPRGGTSCGLTTENSSGFDVDISGKSVTSTLAEMRLYGSYAYGLDYSTYGPIIDSTDPAYTATFASGSRLRYQLNTTVQDGDFFNTNSSVKVAGTTATTLGSLTAVLTGGFTGTATAANTVQIFSFATTDKPDAGTTGVKSVRVSFQETGSSTGNARFFACDFGSSGNPAPLVNCQQIFETTYSIAAQGGKNMLKFAAHFPKLIEITATERGFVEHNGNVFQSGKQPVGAKAYSLRLNQPAYETIFNIFGITKPAQTAVAP